jgi:hypothetical protein
MARRHRQAPSICKLKSQLWAEGGYAFTDVGLLERLDGAPFATDEAVEVLSALHGFLSFVRGIWVCPVLVEGKDEKGRTTWRHWNSGRTSRWKGAASWCDPMNWEAAQQAFGGFMNRWADEFGQAVMRTAVGQYVSANSPDPVEVAIVVAQSVKGT